MRLKYTAISLFFIIGMLFVTNPVYGNSSIKVTGKVPYLVEHQGSKVIAGQGAQFFLIIENYGALKNDVEVSLEFPHHFSHLAQNGNWQLSEGEGKKVLSCNLNLGEEYCEWFDLISFTVDRQITPGSYVIKAIVDGIDYHYPLEILADHGNGQAPMEILSIGVPQDENGIRDQRFEKNSIVVRDQRWDYYKNIITGQGAINKNLQYLTPLSYLGLEIKNPSHLEKIGVVRGYLVDANTHEKVPGLFTPGLEGENNNGGFETLVAFTGEEKQKFIIPIYIEEDLVQGGNYLLGIEIIDGSSAPVTTTQPLRIIKKNDHGMGIIILAIVVVTGGIYWWRRNYDKVLLEMRTSHLITITMFGVVSFVVVTVPANMIMGVFRVLLGPFSSLVTGIFSDITLGMLTMSLLILVPQPGVITLFSLIRMLFSMLVFGHLTPIMFLAYGMNAVILEALLLGTGSYDTLQKVANDQIYKKKLWYIIIFCSIAEMVATYVGLQARSVLYRWYYAPWYIMMTVVVNGFLYTLVGGKIGEKLGRILLKIRN